MAAERQPRLHPLDRALARQKNLQSVQVPNGGDTVRKCLNPSLTRSVQIGAHGERSACAHYPCTLSRYGPVCAARRDDQSLPWFSSFLPQVSMQMISSGLVFPQLECHTFHRAHRQHPQMHGPLRIEDIDAPSLT